MLLDLRPRPPPHASPSYHPHLRRPPRCRHLSPACGPDLPSSYLETNGDANWTYIDFGYSLLDIGEQLKASVDTDPNFKPSNIGTEEGDTLDFIARLAEPDMCRRYNDAQRATLLAEYKELRTKNRPVTWSEPASPRARRILSLSQGQRDQPRRPHFSARLVRAAQAAPRSASLSHHLGAVHDGQHGRGLAGTPRRASFTVRSASPPGRAFTTAWGWPAPRTAANIGIMPGGRFWAP
ncbi:MAG: hypothetical protein U1F87_15030 [Kiritimatiellia bacterium]